MKIGILVSGGVFMAIEGCICFFVLRVLGVVRKTVQKNGPSNGHVKSQERGTAYFQVFKERRQQHWIPKTNTIQTTLVFLLLGNLDSSALQHINTYSSSCPLSLRGRANHINKNDARFWRFRSYRRGSWSSQPCRR